MEEFGNAAERLAYIIDSSGISQRSYAMGAGIDPSNFSKIVNGKKELPMSVARRIEKTYGISSHWLIKGTGDMMKRNPFEKEKDSIPFYNDLQVSAGKEYLALSPASEVPSQYICIPGLSSASYAFPVIGCSMEPTIKAGDIIAVREMDRLDRLDPDKIYMILTRDDRMIKHLAVDNDDDSYLWCLSDNENYPKFRILKSEVLRMWKVVFHGRIL